MIPHNQPTIESEEIKVVNEVLRSRQISQGAYVTKLEKAIAKSLGEKFESIAVSSGTAALYLALKHLGLSKNDEVVVPTYVCSALLNAIFLLEAKPVLVDIDPNDFNISLQETMKKLTLKVKAVVVPHIYGMPAAIDKFVNLKVPIIEDCAQAIGASVDDKPVGGFGEVAIFSFYATKMITTGQGGMVASKNRKLINIIRDYREFDYRRDYKPRFNFQMTDLQAALGLVQFKKLNQFIARRRQIAKFYSEILAEKDYIMLPTEMKGRKSCWYRYVMRTSESLVNRIRDQLDRAGIRTIVPIQTFELLHRYLKLSPEDFPQAEKLAKTTLSLPIFPDLTDQQLQVIGKVLSKV